MKENPNSQGLRREYIDPSRAREAVIFVAKTLEKQAPEMRRRRLGNLNEFLAKEIPTS